MSVSLANVSILTDTTQSMVEKINKLLFSYSSAAITANSTLGVTGSVAAPVNARVFGTIAANTVNSHSFKAETSGTFVANSTHIVHGLFKANSAIVDFGPADVLANGLTGSNNQVLTSSGPGQGVRWSSVAGIGTVTSIVAGDGLNGNTITSSGTISIKAADPSVIVSPAGIQVNAFFVSAITSNAQTLLTKTWASPGAIGTSVANTSNFSSSNSAVFTVGTSYTANSSGVFHSKTLQGTTSDTPALRVKANSSNLGLIHFTNGSGATLYSSITVNSSGFFNYSGAVGASSLSAGTGNAAPDGEIRATGNIIAYTSSDARLKTDVGRISNALDKVLAIGGYNFTWTDDAMKSRGGEDGYFVRSKDVGVIAQEIEKVVPEAVVERADGHLAVRYELLVPLLIEAIKELNDRISK